MIPTYLARRRLFGEAQESRCLGRGHPLITSGPFFLDRDDGREALVAGKQAATHAGQRARRMGSNRPSERVG